MGLRFKKSGCKKQGLHCTLLKYYLPVELLVLLISHPHLVWQPYKQNINLLSYRMHLSYQSRDIKLKELQNIMGNKNVVERLLENDTLQYLTLSSITNTWYQLSVVHVLWSVQSETRDSKTNIVWGKKRKMCLGHWKIAFAQKRLIALLLPFVSGGNVHKHFDKWKWKHHSLWFKLTIFGH